MNEPLVRTFIAINLPANLRAAIAINQSQLKKKLSLDCIKWTEPNQLHITLRFLGEILQSQVSALETILGEITPKFNSFSLNISGIGVFPDIKRPRVIWVGISGETRQLFCLAKAIADATSNIGQIEEREFHPHITLGRVKSSDPSDLRTIGTTIQHIKLEQLGEWHVTQIDLMKSTLTPKGPIYECLKSFSLQS